ncbi:MAG: hypothetical protein KGJ02_03905 [Verrucomicrobiota bacterium]|nr:hypothetical protein [Verrucomicrobiota bacterium]
MKIEKNNDEFFNTHKTMVNICVEKFYKSFAQAKKIYNQGRSLTDQKIKKMGKLIQEAEEYLKMCEKSTTWLKEHGGAKDIQQVWTEVTRDTQAKTQQSFKAFVRETPLKKTR